MKFNDFAKAALSNDIICIMDDVYSHEGKIIREPEPAYKMIDGLYADMEIDRFTMIPREDGTTGKMFAVSFKNLGMNSDSIKEMFPDWEEMEPGTWSIYGKILTYGIGNKKLEIGLYREPLDNDEYAGRYTLQIFDGDEVIFCEDVDDTK